MRWPLAQPADTLPWGSLTPRIAPSAAAAQGCRWQAVVIGETRLASPQSAPRNVKQEVEPSRHRFGRRKNMGADPCSFQHLHGSNRRTFAGFREGSFYFHLSFRAASKLGMWVLNGPQIVPEPCVLEDTMVLAIFRGACRTTCT